MRHEFIDKYSKQSNLSEFDPRAKIIGILFFICAVALLQDTFLLLFSLAFILCLLAISGVPATHIAKRYAVALPFIIFAAMSLYWTSGQENAINLFLRISASVLALILIAITTDFFDLLRGLQSLKIPGIMISMLMFTYRYIFVMFDELRRMGIARRARAYRNGGSMLDRGAMGVISSTAGMLLVRAYERGLRISDSLRARGYDGEVRTARPLKMRARDGAMASLLVFMAFYLLSFQMGVLT